ncbi:hypothetical protein DSCO28_41760 [Desulfosarcina ovata subsp. sediminis]|uniref:MalT-like TPR region domain-containing protein n=1 Tax=Desulfosarcina ovata subsp. sediminis TaxID=885957 RepID=A0A5K7ZTT6_9BACT|nr:tetratricopeptide repeat protein [Desulfosarcina ovata]BBO83610.1 hypothetical protein DSCO28_41760 [Desulfosarcina ovata subsp. sediminis]
MAQIERISKLNITFSYIGDLHSWHQEYLRQEADGEDVIGRIKRDEWPHIDKLHKWCVDRSAQDPAAARLVSNLTCVAWEFLMILIPVESQVLWLEQALQANEHCNIETGDNTLATEKAALLHYLAAVNLTNNNLERASDFAKQAYEAANRAGTPEIMGAAGQMLGQIHLDRGQHEQAVEALTRAINVYDSQGSNRIGALYNSLGQAYFKGKDYERAIQSYDQALQHCERVRSQSLESTVLTDKGNALLHLKRYEAAGECAAKALEIARNIGDKGAEGIAWGLKLIVQGYQNPNTPPTFNDFDDVLEILEASGNLRYHRNFLQIIRGFYESWLDNHAQAPASPNLCFMLFKLSSIYKRLDDLDAALKTDQRLMETAEKAGDKYYVFVARGSMGSVHVRRETYREAVDVLEKAVQAVPELDDPSKRNEIKRNRAVLLHNLGIAYRHLNEPEKAQACHEQVLSIAKALEDKDLEMTATENIGLIKTDLQDHDGPIRCHKQCLDYYLGKGDYRSAAICQFNLAHAHGEKGDIDMAIAIGEKALERMQQLNDPHVEKVAKQLDRWRENRAHRRLG